MSGRERAVGALAAGVMVWALAGAACSAIGGGDTLSDAQQVIAELHLGPSELNVVGGVADRYRAGSPIVLSVEVNQPAHVAVLRVLRSGATAVIFPNREHPSAQVAANSPLRIPDPGSSLPIAPDEPGVVLFEFIAAQRSDSWLFHRTPVGSGELAELGTTTRALANDVVTSLKPGPGSATAAAHLTVRVAPP